MKLSDKKLFIGVSVGIVLLVVGGTLVGFHRDYLLVSYHVLRSENEDALLLKLAEIEKRAPGASAIKPLYERLCLWPPHGTVLYEAARTEPVGASFPDGVLLALEGRSQGDDLRGKWVKDKIICLLSTSWAVPGEQVSLWTVANLGGKLHVVSLVKEMPSFKGNETSQKLVQSWKGRRTFCEVELRNLDKPVIRVNEKTLDPAGAPYLVLIQSDGKIYDIRSLADIRKKKR
jgi:hypothetical protein